MLRSLTILPLLLIGAMSLSSCDDADTIKPPPSTSSNTITLRIISLSPALTQMIVDLGLGDKIVGVSPDDNAAPPNTPVVGTYVSPDMETIIKLQPTHVFTASGKEGTPQALIDRASSGEFVLASFKHPHSVLEVINILVHGDDAADIVGAELGARKSIGSVLDMQSEAGALSATLSEQVLVIRKALAGQNLSTKVLPIVTLDPPRSSGNRTIISELIYKAQAFNVFGDSVVDSPVVDREMILKADPDVILIFQPNGAPLGPIDEDPRLTIFRGLKVPAVTESRIVLIDHPLCQLPSTTTGIVFAEIAKAIHPHMSDVVDQAMSAPDQFRGPAIDLGFDPSNLEYSEPDDIDRATDDLDTGFTPLPGAEEQLDLGFSDDQ